VDDPEAVQPAKGSPLVRALSLHQVAAADASPAELVRVASALGCRHVCLFTQGFGEAFPFPVVRDHEVAELKRLMDGLGVSVLGTTSFPLTPTLAVASYAAGLARSEELGSRVANVRFLDTDRSRLVENFGGLAELAARHGVELSIEFTGFGATGALAQALEVIRLAGRGKISIDPLHIVRTGTPLEALRRLAPGMIGYLQFCDGPLVGSPQTYGRESSADRLPPGDGEFPLVELLALIPPDMPISLEVPQEPARLSGVSVMERCRRAVQGMRRVIEHATLADGQGLHASDV
jgi:sugar phosphate isomerase/epimerase